MTPFSARIVILNFNGEGMLPLCLPSIVEAASFAKTPTAVTVLDNLSTDGSESYVREKFPNVVFIKAPQNLVLCSYNAYLKEMTEDVAILLNNDIRVDPGFVDPLIEKFAEDPRTFLVAPRVMTFDGRGIEAADSRAGIRFGMFWCNARYPGYEAHLMLPSTTYSSGFGAFSREKFIRLGGYDERYFPGIYEDVDLCLRAARSGDHLYYEPRSLVYHMGQASFKKAFSNFKRESLAHRNSFLFMWKNFQGLQFWIPHVCFLPLRMLWMALRGQLSFAAGFFQALGYNARYRNT